MDALFEDGSHEATIAMVRALVVAIPHTTDRFRDYLLSKISQLTATPLPASDVMHRRDRANAFCESIRALDATVQVQGTSIVFGSVCCFILYPLSTAAHEGRIGCVSCSYRWGS